MTVRDSNGKFVKNGTAPEVLLSDSETAPPDAEIPPAAENTAPDGDMPPGKRGRGRPPGSGKNGTEPKKRAGATKSDPDKLARQIVGGHLLAATFTGLPELAVSVEEGRILADAAIGMADEYGLAISGKTSATLQLLAALGMVYAPRAILIIARINTAQQAGQAQQRAQTAGPAVAPNGKVYEMRPHE